MTTSKSWKLTIATLIIGVLLPFVNGFLPAEQAISEEFANTFIYIFLGVGAIGASKAVVKKQQQVKEKQIDAIQAPASYNPPSGDPVGMPKLTNTQHWYQSNFVKGERGNALPFGEPYLWLKVTGVRSYITAKLENETGKVIQIEQTGHPSNPWKNAVRLEMYSRINGDIVPLPRGVYAVTVTGDRGSSDSNQITDKFEIV